MLRHPRSGRWPAMHVRLTSIVALFVVGLAATRLESAAAAPEPAAASENGAAAQTRSTGLEFVPRDAAVVVSARPAALLSHAGVKPLAELIELDKGTRHELGLPAAELSRVTLVLVPAEARADRDAAGLIVHAKNPFDAGDLLSRIAPDAERKTFEGQTYHLSRTRGNRLVHVPDERTVLMATREPVMHAMLTAGPAGPADAPWTRPWPSVRDGHVAVAANCPRIREFMQKATATAPPELVSRIAPLWNGTDAAVVSLQLGERLTVQGRLECQAAGDASQVEQALRTVLQMAQAGLQQQREQPANPRRGAASLLWANEFAGALLDALAIDRQQKVLHVETGLDSAATEKASEALLGAVRTARQAVRASQSFNNLRHLALAMHNYHDRHGKFPPPVVIGPDGKTPHSWRVAVLPYLDQRLYDQYRLDEPWDSPHNKQLLAKMPGFFRSPFADPDSTSTSYFALTGEATAFYGNEGTPIRDIVDGTSNTLLMVEAKRDVPWTKPEDIAYDESRPVPKLGGYVEEGFGAVFADGSARLVSNTIPARTLRALITIDGREVVGEIP